MIYPSFIIYLWIKVLHEHFRNQASSRNILFPLCVCVLVARLCPTICYPVDSSVHEIFQARILEWAAISFSRGLSRPRDWTWVSCLAGRLFTVWTTREVSSLETININSQYLSTHPEHNYYSSQQEAVALLQAVTTIGAPIPPYYWGACYAVSIEFKTLVWFLGQEDPLEKG